MCEEDLGHLSINSATSHQFSFLCPCPVATPCPVAAASHSIGHTEQPSHQRATPAVDAEGSGLPGRRARAPASPGSAPEGCLRHLAFSSGTCVFSWGTRRDWRVAAGSASAAGSAEGAGTISSTVALARVLVVAFGEKRGAAAGPSVACSLWQPFPESLWCQSLCLTVTRVCIRKISELIKFCLVAIIV